MHPAADVSWCQLQVGDELIGGMRGINGKRDRPVKLLIRAYLPKGFFLSKGVARGYQHVGDVHRPLRWANDLSPSTVSSAQLALAYGISLAPVPRHSLAQGYSKSSLTASCHPWYSRLGVCYVPASEDHRMLRSAGLV